MKTFKKKLISIVTAVAVLSTTSVSAIAPDQDPNFTATEGRRFYTPSSAIIELAQRRVYFKNLSWTNSAWGTGHYWEGEVRGYNGANISDAYLGVTAIAGNLPNMYKEYDSDDLSLGCSELSGLVAGNTYYATLTTEMADSFNDGVELWFESEYGDWYGWFGENGDGDPLRYQLFAERFHTTDNRILYW